MTNYETIITDALYSGVYDGGINVDNDSGNLDLGLSADYDYSVVYDPGSAPVGLLDQPDDLQGSLELVSGGDEEEDEEGDDENNEDENEDEDDRGDDRDRGDDEGDDDEGGDDEGDSNQGSATGADIILDTPGRPGSGWNTDTTEQMSSSPEMRSVNSASINTGLGLGQAVTGGNGLLGSLRASTITLPSLPKPRPVDDSSSTIVPTVNTDTTPPTISSIAVNAAGDIVITYSESVAGSTVEAGDYNVTVDGTGNFALTGASVSGTTVTLTTTTKIHDTQTVNSVAYTASQGTANSIKDSSNNPATNQTITSITNNSSVDVTAPTVASFTSTTTDGSYKAGDTINITATTNEAVQTGNTITVTLDTGDTVVLTAAGAGTTLVGTYTIGAGDTSSDLTVASFTIGTVADTTGNAMTSTSLPTTNIATGSTLVVDTTAPTTTISAIDISTDSGTSAADFTTNTAGQTITATLSTTLAAGEILYGSVDGGGNWTDVTAKVTGTAISWDGATLSGSSSIQFKVTDAAGNDGAAATQAYVLDTTAPTVSSVTVPANGTYDLGQTMNFTVNFDSNITLTGTNSTLGLTLSTGGTVQSAYLSATATSITYQYTVASGNLDIADGVVVGTITLNGDTITDAAGNSANTTLNSVGTTSAVLVDGVGPSVTLSMNNTTPTEANADTVTIIATLAEAYTSDVTVNLAYSGTATSGGTDYSSGAASITISAGNTTGTTSVTVVDDATDDDAETIIVDITSVTNGTESGTQQQTATITDDDAPGGVDASIVFFDLTSGQSSSHSTRTFDVNTTYTIYIRMDDGDHTGSGTMASAWSAANLLGADDKIILTGNGSLPTGGAGGAVNSASGINTTFSNVINFNTASGGFVAKLNANGAMTSNRTAGSATLDLWTGSWGFQPTSLSYIAAVPTAVAASQPMS